jgi:TetR/AcrR family transcriptional repressor of lmrAB and yxaGH operons
MLPVVSSDTRQRMVETAVRLFRSQGYAATSWRGLVAESGTPWGSVQHHFPGGKQELAVAALGAGEDLALGAIRIAFDRHDNPGDAIGWWFGKAQQLLERSDYEQGCPIAMLALHSGDPVVAQASRDAFLRWQRALAERLVAVGYDPADSDDLALSVLTTLEGALVVAKGLRSSRPLEVAAAEMRVRFAP